jgi:predicted lactoylglutathione lyase
MMARKIFVNLPVQSLERSVAFFTALGFSFNAHFTDETATCMIVADDIFVMLLTHDKFQQFTPKQLCDTTVATEVLVCLSAESRGEVDALVARPSRRAAASTGSRWITASCMATVSRIRMDISGS